MGNACQNCGGEMRRHCLRCDWFVCPTEGCLTTYSPSKDLWTSGKDRKRDG
jgi:hypothetical protein